MARGTLRLVVPTPDGRRIMARPNGLAGWTLPAIAVDIPFAGWDDEVLARATRAVGARVVPADEVATLVWAVRVTDRIPAAGTTWIGPDDVDRLGHDAVAARAWFVRARSSDDG